MGSAVGVAVFGAVANATLANRLARPPTGLPGPLPSPDLAGDTVLDHAATTDPATLAFLRSALFDASHHVFLGMLVLAVLSVGAVLLVPRRITPLTFPEGSSPDPAPTPPEQV
jgi:hypothetical protein